MQLMGGEVGADGLKMGTSGFLGAWWKVGRSLQR